MGGEGKAAILTLLYCSWCPARGVKTGNPRDGMLWSSQTMPADQIASLFQAHTGSSLDAESVRSLSYGCAPPGPAGLTCNHGHGVLAFPGLKHAYLTHIRRATRSASVGHVSFDPTLGFEAQFGIPGKHQ
jgi:hypothetical protein